MKISAGLDTDGAIDRVIERAQKLRELGITDVWSSQIFGSDTLTVIAVVGREVGLNFGTGVVPIQPRHPSQLAAQARTVQSAIQGTLSLGIGLSHQVVVEGMWGLPFDRPGTRMREYLEAMGPMLRGEAVALHGDTLTAVTMGAIGPREVATPGLLVAALGPAMLAHAGRLTDGTVLWMTGPKTIASHIAPVINEAAAAAGRPTPRIVCGLPISVTNDVAAAKSRIDEELAIYPTLPSYAAMLAREGAATASDIALVGSAEQVTDAIGRLAESGATEFNANVVGTPAEREATLALVGALAAS